MNYFIQEVKFERGEKFKKTAWGKAREDVDSILASMGMTPIEVVNHEKERNQTSFVNKLKWHYIISQNWEKELTRLKSDDVLLIQFPILEHSLLLYRVIRKIKERGVKIVLIVHDLETIRFSLLKTQSKMANLRVNYEETKILREASKVILHNSKMVKYVEGFGIPKDKTVELTIFDYLYDGVIKNQNDDDTKDVVIAGNLSRDKAGYTYALPEGITYQLYGIKYEGVEEEYVVYHGSFPPNELPGIISGGFGLVWDGPSAQTCEGVYGEYMKINNPHKASLYLTAGLPIIIWKEAALADFVKDNNVGICVRSLSEIKEVISSLSSDEYEEMAQNARLISMKLRSGYYTKQAVMRTINAKVKNERSEQ